VSTPYAECTVPTCTGVDTPYAGCIVPECTDVDTPYAGCTLVQGTTTSQEAMDHTGAGHWPARGGGSAAQHGGIHNAYCSPSNIISEYGSATEAVDACLSDSSCLFVGDRDCDNVGVWQLCLNGGKGLIADVGDEEHCMYEKA
jgi:hypothetical protein